MPRPGHTTLRGYGAHHQRLRTMLLTAVAGQLCPHCNRPMWPGQNLDLDHTDDRTAYRGLAHSSCNRRAGAVKGNAARARKPRRSRSW